MYVKEEFPDNSSAPGSYNRTTASSTASSSASVDAQGDHSQSDAASQTKPTPFKSRKNLMRLFGTSSGTSPVKGTGEHPDSGVSSDDEGEPSKWHAELFGPNTCLLCDNSAIMDKDEMLTHHLTEHSLGDQKSGAQVAKETSESVGHKKEAEASLSGMDLSCQEKMDDGDLGWWDD